MHIRIVQYYISSNRTTMENANNTTCESEINDLLKIVRSLYPDAYVPDIDVSAIQIHQVTSVDSVSLDKQTIKYDKFSEVIEKVMFPYFNVIPTKERNIIHLQYKKVDNYLKSATVTAFVLMRTNQPKEDVVSGLSKWFRITMAEAEKEYEKVENKIEMEIGASLPPSSSSR